MVTLKEFIDYLNTLPKDAVVVEHNSLAWDKDRCEHLSMDTIKKKFAVLSPSHYVTNSQHFDARLNGWVNKKDEIKAGTTPLVGIIDGRHVDY